MGEDLCDGAHVAALVVAAHLAAPRDEHYAKTPAAGQDVSDQCPVARLEDVQLQRLTGQQDVFEGNIRERGHISACLSVFGNGIVG